MDQTTGETMTPERLAECRCIANRIRAEIDAEIDVAFHDLLAEAEQHERVMAALLAASGAKDPRPSGIVHAVEALRRGREQSELLKRLPLPDDVTLEKP
jgi:hypothetical protein